MKRIRISSSIANFSEKLRARYADYGDFKWFSGDSTLFFGAYHLLDWLRIYLHRGQRAVFFCGSDLLTLEKNLVGRCMLRNCVDTRFYVENEVEAKLARRIVWADVVISPMLFDDSEKYRTTYKQSDTPHVWITSHLGREIEYGVIKLILIANSVPEVTFHVYGVERPRPEVHFVGNTRLIGPYFPKNFLFHQKSSNFNEETAKMQGTIRFNKFDGFSENLAKALLRGQYAYSVIPYHGVETITDDASLIEALKELKNKKEPNPASEYWREILSKRVEA